MNTNQKIQNFIVKHKSQKKWRLFTVILSLVIVVSVVSSLIMPAISMTREYLQNSNAMSEDIMLLSEVPDNIKNNAIDVTGASTFDSYITDNWGNKLSGIVGTDNKDSLDIVLGCDYTFTGDSFTKLQKQVGNITSPNNVNTEDYVNLYLNVNLPKDLVDYINGKLSDNCVYDNGAQIGYLFVHENYIAIKFMKDYIDKIQTSNSSSGGFRLNGELKRSNTESGDQILGWGNQSVTVDFPDKKASLEKGSPLINYDGTITWTVTVYNTDGLDLNGYTLTDSMLDGAKDVVINPNDAANPTKKDDGTHSGDTITFNSTTAKSITITYKTDITEEQLKDTNNANGTRTNTATLKKPGGDKADEKQSTVPISNPITVDKRNNSKTDYESGQNPDGKINWEIKVKSVYGTSLNNYIVSDNMLSQAVAGSLKITPEGVTLVDGKIVVPEGVTASEVIIKYQTKVNPNGSDEDRTKTNTVIVNYPSGGKAGEDTKTITYKKASDMISFTKNGSSYDKDTHEITWTINITPQGGYSLNGYTLIDNQFPTDISKFTFSPEWVDGGKLVDQIDTSELSNGQLKFKDDCNIKQNVVITYKTTLPDDVPIGTGTQPVYNPIRDNHSHTTTATIYVNQKRETMNKSVQGSTETTIANNKEIKHEIKWNVDITYDDSFAGKTYTDTLSVPTGNGFKHELKADSVVVKAKKKESDWNYITIPPDRYDFVKSANGDSFTIKFHNDFDSSYNYVNITYATEATIPADAAYDTKYTFNNKGSGFGNGDTGDGYGITKTNPEKKESLNLGISKNWTDNNNSANDRPSEVYVKVLYNTKTGNQWGSYDNAEWKQYGSIIKLTGGSTDGSWSSSLNDLPKSETKADATTGQPLPTVYYFYKLIEVDSAGNPINYIDTANGIYQTGNSSEISDNGTLSITNTYYSDTEISASKNWSNDTGFENNRQPIKVRLEYNDNDGTGWHPVDGIEEQELNNSNNWTYKFNGKFPRRIINDNVITERKYRIVETKFGDTAINDNNKIIVIEGSGYYECGINGSETSSNTNNASETLSVTNTFHETKKLTVSGKKVWSDTDHTDNRPSQVIFKLQRSANNGPWEPFGEEQTVDVTGNEQTFSWSDGLVSQEVVDGKPVNYRYRIVEVGYVYEGTTYRLPESAWESPKFATKEEEGYYEGAYRTTYGGNELTTSGEITITNTFNTLEMEITPQKKWVGSDGLDSVKFRLQRRVNGGDWEDVTVDALGNPITDITLQSNPDTDYIEYGWENSQQVVSATTWKGETIKNLPQKEVKMTLQNDGSYKYEEKPYYYRFVEVVTNDNGVERVMDTSGDYFKKDGKYTVTLGNDMNYTGAFTITNTYTEDIGVDKTVVNEDLNNKSELMTVEKEDLIAENSPYRKTINGEEYYVFNWVISFDKAGKSNSTYDQLPKGFTLIADTTKKVDWSAGGQNIIDYTTLFDPITPNYCKDGYFYRPFMIYSNIYLYATNPSANKGINNVNEASGLNIIGQTGDNYYYDKTANRIYFSKPSVDPGIVFQVCYSTKIKCSDLEQMIEEEDLNLIKNHVVKLEDDGTETDQTAEASVFIKNTAPSNLISKEYRAKDALDKDGNPKYPDTKKLAPGYVKFSLDINPEGKNLSTGDTIDVEDIFKTSYYATDPDTYNKTGTKKYPREATGENLVDVLMHEITIYEVDANGVETLLPRSEYTKKFQSKESGVSDSTGENGAALIKLTLPDEKHIKIYYTYKLITNNNTPTVKNECMSRVGRPTKVVKGSDIPGGDIIKFTNTAKLSTESASDDSTVKETEYKMANASAYNTLDRLPKIKKVNIGNPDFSDLDAKFLIARYSKTQLSWEYATEIIKNANGNNEITTWGEKVTDKTIDEAAIEIDVNTEYEYSIAVDNSSLYKLIEIKVPDGYEGSNLGLTGEQFKALIVNYLNDGITVLNGIDYKVFLEKYVPIHYFIYNSTLDDYPPEAYDNDIDKVIQVNKGADIEIPDNELINIGVSKEWNDGDKDDAEITVELYWDYKKSTIGMPETAKRATAKDLGIMDSEFNAIQTKKVSELNTNPPQPLWTDLPNGKDDSPIYYYIKETAYKINGVTYTLVEDEENSNNGKYVSEAGTIGKYYPTYIGNAANSDTTIKVNNSTELKLIKLWKDSSNNPLKESKITATSITVDIYGTKNDITSAEELIFYDVVITPDATTSKWELDITNLLEKEGSNIDLSQYKSFRAEETSTDPNFKVDDYVVSCVFNLNNSTGEITITNKKIGATSASVTANKAWSDGDTVHENESIEVSLYRSKIKIDNIEKLTQDQLSKQLNNNPSIEKMTDTQEQQYTIKLNAENDWTYTWTGLPLYEDDENEIGQYYYYVLENTAGIANEDKYTASYTKDKSSSATKTVFNIKNTRNSVVAQKEWYDENGNRIQDIIDPTTGEVVIDNTSQLPSVQLKVYKSVASVPEGGLSISSVGDSITEGYATGYSGAYLPYLKNELENTYSFNSITTHSHGYSQRAIKKMPDGEDYTSGENRDGILNNIQSNGGVLRNDNSNVVCLMAGTNDIISNYPNNIDGRLEELINEIYSQTSNDVVLFVSSIPKFRLVNIDSSTTESYGWFGYYSEKSSMNAKDFENYLNNTAIKNYNDKIKALVNKLKGQGKKISFVDVYSGLDIYTDVCNDGCHPNSKGDETIADIWAKAISEYYTKIEYVQENGTDKIITLNRENNWTASIDVPDSGEYSIEEVNVPEGWTVSYNDNAQKAGSTKPITVINTKEAVPKTSIELEKTWVGDRNGDEARNDINLILMQGIKEQLNISSDEYNNIKDNVINNEVTGGYSYVKEEDGKYYRWTWTPYNSEIKEPSNKNISDKWTYVFGVDSENSPTLPTKDINGNTCYYKVDEDDLPGYSATYGDDEGNGLVSVDNASAGTLRITNTRLISLKVQKQWSDGENHEDKHITVQLYRSTNINDVPDVIKDNLMLQVPSAVSFGTNSETTVTANKAITSVESDNENVTVKIDANDATKIIIKSNDTECKATITVSDGSEEATINVTVSSLKMFLDSGTDFTIEAGQTRELSATKDGATFRVVSGGDVVSISGTTLTAKKDGTAVISATANGVTVEQTITVILPSTFTIDGESEVTIGSDIQLTPTPGYGAPFNWKSSDTAIATVDSNGKVTGISEGNVTITVTRNDGKAITKTINVKSADVVLDNITMSEAFEVSDYTFVAVGIKFKTGNNGMNGSFNLYTKDNQWDGQQISKNYNQNDGLLDDIYIYNVSHNDNSKKMMIFYNNYNSEIEKVILYKSNPLATRSAAPRRLSSQSASEDAIALAAGETALTGELVATQDIKYTDGWTWTKEGLDVYDSNGKPYYYWAVETEVGGYTAVYSFTDSDDETSNCLNASSIGDGLITIKNIKTVSEGVTMPSTGGTGTTWYYITGAIFVISSGTIGTLRLRRRKKKAA